MPYRDQAKVDAWVRGFLVENPDLQSVISVLEKDFVSGLALFLQEQTDRAVELTT